MGSKLPEPWSVGRHDTSPIGELWFERPGERATETSLLFKLLFTSQPLSIQVHPTDVIAHRLGLARGKTELWYVLSACEGAEVAIGLTRRLTAPQLREAVIDGSIVDLVKWRLVAKDDVIFVPAGTIHALGAGLVVAEVQQRSDTTFRLFDFGRGRRLDVENSVGCADAGPAGPAPIAGRLTDTRILLVSREYFTFERFELPALSAWSFFSKNEAWIFALQGNARCGAIDLSAGEAVFMQDEPVPMAAGDRGLICLVAYAAPRPSCDLLRHATTGISDSQTAEFFSNLALFDAANPSAGPAGTSR
jgi:mannose-6-phosphate isomerase